MTQTEMAKALGVSQPTVAGYVARGMPLTGVEDARAWLDANLAWRRRKGVRVDAATAGEAPMRWSASAMAAKMAAARLAREEADAGAAALRVAQMRRELVSVTEMRVALARHFTGARELLLTLPDRVAPLVAPETDPTAVHRLLYAEMHHALLVLSGAGEELAAMQENAAGSAQTQGGSA